MTDIASIDLEAARWVARQDKGAWTDADEAELQDWLRADPRHAGALLRAEASWVALDQCHDLSQGEGEERSSSFGRRKLLVGGGAALAASLAGGFFWLRGVRVYETDKGEIRRVQLGDGSIAAINTETWMDVDFAARDRHVRIDRGEAWFQVAKNPKRPFVVAAGDVRAVAVGTAFSVKRQANGAEILVTEGVVEAWGVREAPKKIRLVAGERVFIADDAAVTVEAGGASVDRALAWRNGKIDLAGETLSQAIAEFNRYNRRKLILADPAFASEQFDGSFRIDDVEGFATAVKASLNIPVFLDNPEEIQIGKPDRT